ncbi:protein-tyrosine-phosphatase [bacterium]|nr:MAG: protein-tyrosine-phosphatase [bacterium]
MNSRLEIYLVRVKNSFNQINEERKAILLPVSEYISQKILKNESVKLVFICTHNSRRSHLSQIWAQLATHIYGLSGKIECYSGGTEATAFNPRAVEAVKRAGFQVEFSGIENPIYSVFFDESEKPIQCFSKRYDSPKNPSYDFAAIMTCDDADANCPIVLGADARFPVKYIDPKVSDNTEKETQTYDERCFQIATEMMFMISKVKKV